MPCIILSRMSLLYPGHLWVRRHLSVSTVVVWAQDTKHGDTRCYQGWPTSGSGPLIEYTSLDKLGYRCKDDLSSVSTVTRPLLDPGPASAAVVNIMIYRSASHTIKQKLSMLTINLSNKNTKMGPSKTNALRSYA